MEIPQKANKLHSQLFEVQKITGSTALEQSIEKSKENQKNIKKQVEAAIKEITEELTNLQTALTDLETQTTLLPDEKNQAGRSTNGFCTRNLGTARP